MSTDITKSVKDGGKVNLGAGFKDNIPAPSNPPIRK